MVNTNNNKGVKTNISFHTFIFFRKNILENPFYFYIRSL